MKNKTIKNDQDVLSLVYKINEDLDYKIEDNIVTIMIAQNHLVQRIFRKIGFKIVEHKNVVLDEYCSFVFMEIDGYKTVEQIALLLEDKYHEDAHPLYERLLLFINHIEINEKYISRI